MPSSLAVKRPVTDGGWSLGGLFTETSGNSRVCGPLFQGINPTLSLSCSRPFDGSLSPLKKSRGFSKT